MNSTFNIVDLIVTVVLLAPLVYGALRYYRRVRPESPVADGIVDDLTARSRMAASPPDQTNQAHP
jgi:hypothetical protein